MSALESARVYLVWGSTGTYEEHREWVSSIHATETGAQSRIAQLQTLLESAKTLRPANNAPYEAYDAFWTALGAIDSECSGTPDADDLKWVIVETKVLP